MNGVERTNVLRYGLSDGEHDISNWRDVDIAEKQFSLLYRPALTSQHPG